MQPEFTEYSEFEEGEAFYGMLHYFYPKFKTVIQYDVTSKQKRLIVDLEYQIPDQAGW